MSLTNQDLFHGAVLSRLLHSGDVAVRLFEKSAGDRCVYLVDGLPAAEGSTFLYVKYSVTPVSRGATRTWSFTFAEEHLRHLGRLEKEEGVTLILVCGRKDLGNGGPPMQLCVLHTADIKSCADLEKDLTASIQVEYEKGCKLRVRSKKLGGTALKISANRIDTLVGVA